MQARGNTIVEILILEVQHSVIIFETHQESKRSGNASNFDAFFNIRTR